MCCGAVGRGTAIEERDSDPITATTMASMMMIHGGFRHAHLRPRKVGSIAPDP
jgi:hypothetical protein